MSDTSTVTRIRRPRRDTQRKINSILSAATRLFLRDGYTATSMDAVALEAGVSKRTVYGHFGSKDELFASIIREMCAEILPSATATPARSDDDVEDILTRMGTVFLSSVYTPAQIQLMRTVIAESPHHPEVGNMMFEGPIMASRQVVVDYFERLVRDGVVVLDDVPFAAAQFTGMLKTDLHMRLLIGMDVPLTRERLESISRKCVKVFLYGVMAQQ